MIDGRILVRKLVDVFMGIRSQEMLNALQEEFQRRSARYDIETSGVIEQRIGDFVELTGIDLEHFNFRAAPGMIGKVIGITHNGRLGRMIIVDESGDFIEQNYTRAQVRTLARESNDLLN